jgi:hypothetical protein
MDNISVRRRVEQWSQGLALTVVMCIMYCILSILWPISLVYCKEEGWTSKLEGPGDLIYHFIYVTIRLGHDAVYCTKYRTDSGPDTLEEALSATLVVAGVLMSIIVIKHSSYCKTMDKWLLVLAHTIAVLALWLFLLRVGALDDISVGLWLLGKNSVRVVLYAWRPVLWIVTLCLLWPLLPNSDICLLIWPLAALVLWPVLIRTDPIAGRDILKTIIAAVVSSLLLPVLIVILYIPLVLCAALCSVFEDILNSLRDLMKWAAEYDWRASIPWIVASLALLVSLVSLFLVWLMWQERSKNASR